MRDKIKRAALKRKKRLNSILDQASIDEKVLEKSRKASTKIKIGR